ncbi:DegV family protein [Streptococcus cuniculipharyngis]|uniref:DegV family protein n=1 Tax=Streptococcus cuniculipharyngis TaxID=1562651 RepID=A0A5C5SFK9_9STRE|nr:DegV family protein [Streptococcus cuniculipharyngis]TWS99082.1 DegV family protein [Streptococcus cuniculipharyngis]
MKLAVITDSSAYLTEHERQHPNLYCLDIPIIIDKESYVEGKNLSLEEFYRHLRQSGDLPTTSQPSLAELTTLLEQLAQEGYSHVLGLFLSSGISGFWQNIQYLIDDYEMTLAFPDTKITSAPLGSMVKNVLAWSEQGYDFPQLLELLQQQIDGTGAFIMVDDLNHLVRGGRLSNGAALLGNLLSIKPILYFNQQGVIEVFDKVRTEKKAQKRLIDILEELTAGDAYEIFIIHSRADDKADSLYQQLLAEGYAEKDLTIVPFNSVIATHLGEGAIALGMTPKLTS